MIRMRIAGGAMALTVLAGIPACASSDPPAATNEPTTTAVQPPAETLTPMLEQALPNVQGTTFTSAIVDFPPGARAVPHRHGNAFVYAYVLQGNIRSELDDQPTRTYRQGENWVEQPGAHHVLTENASRSEAAKLLVVFISKTGDKLKIDDPHP